MRIFVLGAGATGGYLAQLLLRQGHQVWCGDRDPERARRFLDPALRCEPANARNLWSMVRAGRGCHLLVNAAPATFNETVLRAALRLRAHYLDTAANLGRNPFKAEQLAFARRFEAKRRVAVITAGLAPGLTNLLVARSAARLDAVEEVFIRLYENTESEQPVSTWSAEIAHDEAVARPRVYRGGRFKLARRFSEPEWFNFGRPVGRARVVLAAQDEVATLPHFIPMKVMDVKFGGKDVDRLRRWYRQGRLRPSEPPARKRFPPTLSPRRAARLLRRGVLMNARFAAAVLVRGIRRGERLEHRWDCLVPSLYQLRQKGLLVGPIPYATAHTAAAFVKYWPTDLHGVFPPEALPERVQQAALGETKRRDLRISLKARPWKRAVADEDEEEV